ncbi:tripartite tricarboxylate transporter substrate binding protein [Roseococcus pinisoli]|uniref:Tripartite tricarboxylate transporter substrate binding protein n=1 Tax=Roseococcus pinisoli TaxID=2835040 RepID=A0ABS5QIT8_9PROT|nr:tripartite tricarboxylate transporter substrate binding protein [Roseococcus pinisoli]MBS7813601.1 tripartite tricarboxylate transporter substrate binding protein [Roseococcus pinisoli]
MQTRRHLLGAGAGLAGASALPVRNAGAADWPGRPVTLLVPWAPGGGTDAVGRALARGLSARLGVPVPVLNRAGGNGTIGHMAIRDAAPDGHTIGFVVPQLITAPLLGPVPVTWRELQPLALLNADPAAITVGAAKPWRTLAEFVEEARRQPRTLRVGNSGQGGAWHMAALELEKKAGIELIHVPYASAGPALQDLVGGHIDAVAFSAAEARAPVSGGQARMIAVAAPERLRAYPEVATAREQGFDLDVSTWRGLATAKGTPAAILARLEDAVRQSLEDEAFQGFMTQQGFGVRFMQAAAFETFLAEQDAKYHAYFGG